jgi:polysaccharide export outer membrane protein
MSIPRSRTTPVLAVCALSLISACSTLPGGGMPGDLGVNESRCECSQDVDEESWLAIGDSIQITDQNHEELTVDSTLDIDGTVVLPRLGAVMLAGLTGREIEALLTEKYSPQYEALDIRVRIQSVPGKKYFVFGEVNLQGARDFRGDLTIFEAVTQAQPRKDSANLGRVRLIRADARDPFITTIDLGEIIGRGDSTLDVHIQENEVLSVPPAQPKQ